MSGCEWLSRITRGPHLHALARTIHMRHSLAHLQRRYEIKFGQVYLSKPFFVESDGKISQMMPQEARLRNLTYASQILIDITKRTLIADPLLPANEGVTRIEDMTLEQEGDEEVLEQVYLGTVPIMLRSSFCVLSSMSSKDIYGLGECPYDSVGVRFSDVARDQLNFTHVIPFHSIR